MQQARQPRLDYFLAQRRLAHPQKATPYPVLIAALTPRPGSVSPRARDAQTPARRIGALMSCGTSVSALYGNDYVMLFSCAIRLEPSLPSNQSKATQIRPYLDGAALGKRLFGDALCLA